LEEPLPRVSAAALRLNEQQREPARRPGHGNNVWLWIGEAETGSRVHPGPTHTHLAVVQV